MVSSRKLSDEEVEALVGELSDQETESKSAAPDKADVRPYEFGLKDAPHPSDYYALKTINDRFCRGVRSVFVPMIRLRPRITASPPEIMTFEEYRDGFENFVSMTSNWIDELRGNQLIVIPPSFVSMLTDAYFGGQVRHIKTANWEFTATELRVIEIIVGGMNYALHCAWRDMEVLTFTIQNHEENPQLSSSVDGDDQVLICSFMVQLPDTDPASFDILYPLNTLKPLAFQLRSRFLPDAKEDDLIWRDRMEQAVLSIPLTVTAKLTESDVQMRKLMTLETGEILAIHPGDAIKVRVEDLELFDATLGELGKRVALKISRLIP